MKKRILVLLSVVALMVVMLATSVAPAFAAWESDGCRTGDLLIEADRLPPDLASVNGKRTDDPFICISPSANGRLHVYDNRPVTIP